MNVFICIILAGFVICAILASVACLMLCSRLYVFHDTLGSRENNRGG